MCFNKIKGLSPQRRGDSEKNLTSPCPSLSRRGLGLSASYVSRLTSYIFLMALFAGCGGMADDLNPSGSDQRPTVSSGTTGTQVGQTAPDFAVTDSLGNTRTLSSELAALAQGDALVFYFTMWCPICDSHQTNMLSTVVPAFPNSRYYLVDYVSGSVQGTRDAEVSNGWSGSGFVVLADTDRSKLSLFNATMSTTIVIDKSGTVRMNEDYKDGTRLVEILKGLK